MKVKLLMVGKTKAGYIQEGLTEYKRRIEKYVELEEKIVAGLKSSSGLKPSDIQRLEGELLLKEIRPDSRVVLLDEKGKLMRSLEFASFLENFMISGVKYLTFVIGGAYGFSRSVYERADDLIALSPMTFSHQLARLIFMEQLYRAFTIIRNEPYHNE